MKSHAAVHASEPHSTSHRSLARFWKVFWNPFLGSHSKRRVVRACRAVEPLEERLVLIVSGMTFPGLVTGPQIGIPTVFTPGSSPTQNLGPNATASNVKGNLVILGTNGADTLSVGRDADSVFVEEMRLGKVLAQFPVSSITQITVDVGNGNDYVRINELAISLPTTIRGGYGDDTLIGGGGRDTIYGGPGTDQLTGHAGDDLLFGEAGRDLLVGGVGADQLDGGNDDDLLLGGIGNDILKGQTGADQLYGEAGNDQLVGGDGDNWLEGGPGNDQITGGKGNDSISGGDGEDDIRGGPGDDQILGEGGRDNIDGETGNDMIDAGPSDDIVYGGWGNDMLAGGTGNDFIDAGEGVDWIDGGDGQDKLLGGGGYDALQGGNGNDVLAGGPGKDGLYDSVGSNTLQQGTDPNPRPDQIGSITQEISLGGVIGGVWKGIKKAGQAIGGAVIDFIEWTADRVEQIGRGFIGWIENFVPRLVRLGSSLADAFLSDWPWEKKFWTSLAGDLGRVILNTLELAGLGEALQIGLDILCPWQRGMTKEEIALARTVFGNSIDYSRVRINENSFIARGFAYVFPGYTINFEPALRPNGQIQPDLLLHELTHVWQYEEDGLIYGIEAKAAQMVGGYDYPPGTDKDVYTTIAFQNRIGVLLEAGHQSGGFTSFNREQQGEIIRHYYLLREWYRNPALNPLVDDKGQKLLPVVLADWIKIYARYVKDASTLSLAQLGG